MIGPNNFVEENRGIKVNTLNDVKSCSKDKISPDKESDYMENYKPFISESVVSLVGDESILLLKEKWLDEEPEKISVLKYVATFKDTCSGQGK